MLRLPRRSQILLMAHILHPQPRRLESAVRHPPRQLEDQDLLFEAIRAKDLEEVKRIVALGNIDLDPPRQPNAVNKSLGYSAAYGSLEIVTYLVEQGADIDGRTAYGDVPLIKAAEHDNRETIQYLIEKGADVNAPNAFGISPFIGLSGSGELELVELALKQGGKINESYPNETNQGNGKPNYTALQLATAMGQLPVVELFLAEGGDPWLETEAGLNCLELAREKGHAEIAALIEAMPRVDETD